MQGQLTSRHAKTRDARLTRRRVITAFIAVQVAIPLAMFGARWVNEGSHPVNEYPLSWQMYSAVDTGFYVGVDESQNEVALSTDDLPPIIRGAGYGATVPEMFCSADSELVEIHRVSADPALEAETEIVLC